MNAIHALSQLSYAPIIYSAAAEARTEALARQHPNLDAGCTCVKQNPHSHDLSRCRPRNARQEVREASYHRNARYRQPCAPGLRCLAARARRPPRAIGAGGAERDILDQYLFEVSKTPLLTAEQELAVARRVRAGDQDAMQELVKRNLRFVISVAKKYQNRGMALPDLIGEGNIGLLTAARKFDPDVGVKFISYAVWWIRQAILAAIAKQGRTVRVPLNRTADLSRIIRATEILRQKLVREPTPEEVAAEVSLSKDVVQALMSLNTSEVRLDAALDPGGERTLIDRFVADGQSDVEARAMERFLSEEIQQALWPPSRRATPASSGSTSASTTATSTPSRRSAGCSA